MTHRLPHHGFIETPYINEKGTDMKSIKATLLVFGVAFAGVSLQGDGNLTDDEEKVKIVDFVTLPSRLCGHALIDFRSEFRERKLTNRAWFDGDTNRLARLICELAQTNSTEISSMMIDELGEYGTPAQLPFLYSCATNPIVGDRAVKAALRIDGVSSNSVATLQRYLYFTNVVTTKTVYEKAVACRDFLVALSESSASPDLKGSAILAVRSFASDISTGVSMIDTALIDADNTYRHSKRRLADLRTAYPRCFNEYQTNYVTNAINELVAYPEANLPD